MSNYYVSYSDEAKDDLRNIFMHIAQWILINSLKI